MSFLAFSLLLLWLLRRAAAALLLLLSAFAGVLSILSSLLILLSISSILLGALPGLMFNIPLLASVYLLGFCAALLDELCLDALTALFSMVLRWRISADCLASWTIDCVSEPDHVLAADACTPFGGFILFSQIDRLWLALPLLGQSDPHRYCVLALSWDGLPWGALHCQYRLEVPPLILGPVS